MMLKIFSPLKLGMRLQALMGPRLTYCPIHVSRYSNGNPQISNNNRYKQQNVPEMCENKISLTSKFNS